MISYYEVQESILKKALIYAKNAGWERIEVRTGNKNLVNKLRTKCKDDILIANLLEDILFLADFQECSFFLIDKMTKVITNIANFA